MRSAPIGLERAGRGCDGLIFSFWVEDKGWRDGGWSEALAAGSCRWVRRRVFRQDYVPDFIGRGSARDRRQRTARFAWRRSEPAGAEGNDRERKLALTKLRLIGGKTAVKASLDSNDRLSGREAGWLKRSNSRASRGGQARRGSVAGRTARPSLRVAELGQGTCWLGPSLAGARRDF